MTELEKVNGCFAILVQILLVEANADRAKIATNLTYKGKQLGRYKLTIEKVGDE